MVATFGECSNRPATKLSRNKYREKLMSAYQQAAQKNFKVEKADLKNDLIISKLKNYLYK